MNRRAFLATLAAGAVLDPERLLWKPGKLISIAAPRRMIVGDYHPVYTSKVIGLALIDPIKPWTCHGVIVQQTMTLAEFRKRYP